MRSHTMLYILEEKNIKEQKNFIEYEKAIEARNFHYQNYNKWMNLYAIFNGALFIGLYSILNNHPLCHNYCYPYNSIIILIIILGAIASVCWLLSLTGYYSWMRSFVRIVHEKEKKIKFTVYGLYFGEEGKKNGTLKDDFFSTQKISQVFVFVILIAWGIILPCILYFGWDACDFLILIVTVLVIIFSVWFFYRNWGGRFSLLSNINDMRQWYRDNNGEIKKIKK